MWTRTNNNSRDIYASYIESDRLRIDSTSTNAFVVGRDALGTDILTVNTSDAKVNISGDLAVTGALTWTTSDSFEVKDPSFKLAKDNPANSFDCGIYAEYVESAIKKYKGAFFNVSDSDIFTIFKGAQTEPGNTVAENNGYALADFKASSIWGTLSTAAQPNISSLGTLTSLTSSGNITAPRFITSSAGSVSATALQIGWPGLGLYTPIKDQLNIAANSQDIMQFFGTGINCYKPIDMQAQNITNAGTISANTLTGTLSTGTQTNIISLGTLTGLTVNGAVSLTNGTTTIQNNNLSPLSVRRGSNSPMQISIGRSSEESIIGISGGASQYFMNSVAGDLCIRSEVNNGSIFMGTSQTVLPRFIVSGANSGVVTANADFRLNAETAIALKIQSRYNGLGGGLLIDFYRQAIDVNPTAYIGHNSNSNNFIVYSSAKLTLSSNTGDYRIQNLPSAAVSNIGVNGSGDLYINSSSQRFKYDIADTKINTSLIYQLQAKDFKWRSTNEDDFGYIAEQVNEILPQAVLKDDQGNCQSVKYANMIVLVIEEMKKLKQKNSELEARIAALEN